MPCTNQGCRISVVRISVFPEVHKWGIGIGWSPIGYEGFVQPRKGQGEAKTKLVLQYLPYLSYPPLPPQNNFQNYVQGVDSVFGCSTKQPSLG